MIVQHTISKLWLLLLRELVKREIQYRSSTSVIGSMERQRTSQHGKCFKSEQWNDLETINFIYSQMECWTLFCEMWKVCCRMVWPWWVAAFCLVLIRNVTVTNRKCLNIFQQKVDFVGKSRCSQCYGSATRPGTVCRTIQKIIWKVSERSKIIKRSNLKNVIKFIWN